MLRKYACMMVCVFHFGLNGTSCHQDSNCRNSLQIRRVKRVSIFLCTPAVIKAEVLYSSHGSFFCSVCLCQQAWKFWASPGQEESSAASRSLWAGSCQCGTSAGCTGLCGLCLPVQDRLWISEIWPSRRGDDNWYVKMFDFCFFATGEGTAGSSYHFCNT